MCTGTNVRQYGTVLLQTDQWDAGCGVATVVARLHKHGLSTRATTSAHQCALPNDEITFTQAPFTASIPLSLYRSKTGLIRSPC